MVKIKINLGNKTFYTILAIAIILVVGGFVIAYGGNNPAVMGHTRGEIDVSDCTSGQILGVDSNNKLVCVNSTTGTGTTGVTSASGSNGIIVNPTTGTVSITADTNVLQKRVTGACGVNQAVKSINADGSVNCVSVGSTSTCTMVAKTCVASNGGTCNIVCLSGCSIGPDGTGWGNCISVSFIDAQTVKCTSGTGLSCTCKATCY